MRSLRRYGAQAQAIPAARHDVADVLSGLEPDDVYAIQLMVSELATNCVRHCGTPFDLMIDVMPLEVRVEVTDLGPGRPTVRSPSPTDPTGRGLRIVDRLAHQWGVDASGELPGKKVWFTYRL
jgi:anti-sigma regulatory factor (Ser/Thr protein kinase)